VPGTLYVVATPIGNLQDITFRAVATLQQVDLIAAEDTRQTRKLLQHYQIKTPLTPYHDRNEIRAAARLCEQLEFGKQIALVSDAGTPGLSDPGYRLVNLVRQRQIPVVVVPGPSAVTAALSVSGLPTDRFTFVGFLPRKKGRQSTLTALKDDPGTIIIFEAANRLLKTLSDLENAWGERVVAVCREMTKIHEELFLGSLSAAKNHFQIHTLRGECVLLVAKAGYHL